MSSRDRSRDVALGALTRRRFLGTAGTGALAAAIAGCEPRAAEQIVPAVRRRPESVPGESEPYATASLREGMAIGLVVERRDGRPIKVEGHPEHPASLGATGAIEQALVLSLYDTDRLRAIEHRGAPRAWSELAESIGPRAERRFAHREGEGLALWLEPSSSVVRHAALDALRERFPRLRIALDPASAPAARWEGSRIALGRVVEAVIDPARLDRIVVLDGDPMGHGAQALALQRRWARARKARGRALRLLVAEPTPTLTGLAADERYVATPDEIVAVLGAMARRFLPAVVPSPDESATPPWCAPLLDELEGARGRTAIVIGDAQPAWAHALAHALNAALGAYDEGGPIALVPSPILDVDADPERSLRSHEALLDALDAGALDTLITAGANPAYALPAGARWDQRRARAALHVHLASHADETAEGADWIVPEAHLFERWSDARAFDGTWTTIQPLVRPLFAGHTLEDLVDALLGRPRVDPRARLEAVLAREGHALDEVLARGLVAGSGAAPIRATIDLDAVRAAIAGAAGRESRAAWTIDLRPDLRIGDGRWANVAWLEELPDPITKLTWGNAAQIAPADAARLGVRDGDVLAIAANGATVRIPAYVQPGQAEGVITATLGHGRRAGGTRARGIGVAVGALRGGAAHAWRVRGASVERTGERAELHSAQPFAEAEERPTELRRPEPGEPQEPGEPPSFYPDWPEEGVQWGMAIDLDVCNGCSACVVACQAENDVPVVGPEQVVLGRNMHWLRIDRYYRRQADGEREHARIELQPMLCQHCELAPCEYVCPTHATLHSPDGLNEMIYNRCVGTRFCQNNCPYKVRRFNWFDYHRDTDRLEHLVLNPDVTVRGRGVMEKCTFCVQRIRRAQRIARIEQRALRDGDVVPACMQACPSEAIVFGAISDPESAVSRLHADPRAYAELGHLGTRPRIRYLRRREDADRGGGGAGS